MHRVWTRQAVKRRAVKRPAAAQSGRLALCSIALFATALLATTAGCGVGAYDALMDARAKVLKRGAPFVSLGGAIKLGDTDYRIRLPQVFATTDVEQPLLVKLPGLVGAYQKEEFINGQPPNRYFYTCYLAATGADPRYPAALAAKIKKALPQSNPVWEKEEVDTPEGTKLEWQKMRIEGEMPFDADVGSIRKDTPFPGVLEIWLYMSPKVNVTVFWQIPAEVETKIELLKKAPAVAGTLEEFVPPPPAEQAAPPA